MKNDDILTQEEKAQLDILMLKLKNEIDNGLKNPENRCEKRARRYYEDLCKLIRHFQAIRKLEIKFDMK